MNPKESKMLRTYSVDYWIVIGTRHFRRKELISATTSFEAKAILIAKYSDCKVTIVTVNEVRK